MQLKKEEILVLTNDKDTYENKIDESDWEEMKKSDPNLSEQ